MPEKHGQSVKVFFMRVRKVMRKNVVVLKPADTLRKALATLILHNISGAPVVEKGRVIGLVTESDIIKTIDAYGPKVHYEHETSFAVIYALLKGRKEFEAVREEVVGSESIKVADFMKREVVTIGPDDDIYTAARLINMHDVKRLPVVNKNGKLVGIIARADIIRALAK
ncbi:MAG: CBS domain-containing protein [Candidatus Aenigmatarchaeota archaeon]